MKMMPYFPQKYVDNILHCFVRIFEATLRLFILLFKIIYSKMLLWRWIPLTETLGMIQLSQKTHQGS